MECCWKHGFRDWEAGECGKSLSSPGWHLRFACEAIAAYTIFETIKKVGIRSTATLLTTKPLVFPMSCYLLAPVVEAMLSKWLETLRDSQFDYRSEPDSPERDKKANAFYESRERKIGILTTCRHYVNMLPLASVLYFLTLVQPLSVSVPSKVLR